MNLQIIKIMVFLLFTSILVSGGGFSSGSKIKNRKNSESWASKLCSKIGAFFKSSKPKRKQKTNEARYELKIVDRGNIISDHKNVIQFDKNTTFSTPSLKPMFKFMKDLMFVDVLMKFKLTSAKHKEIKFEQIEQAPINTDMYFVKYRNKIEILGTENYRPGHLEFYNFNDKLNRLEKQFLTDFAALHTPLNEYNFAADWYVYDSMLRSNILKRNTRKLCVISKKVDNTAITGKTIREWDNQSWESNQYNVKDDYNHDSVKYSGTNFIDYDIDGKSYDNVTEMLLRNGHEIATFWGYPLFDALWIGQKSTLHILQTQTHINVNDEFPDSGWFTGRKTAFEFAIKKDMLLVVDEMLKNHNPKLDKLDRWENSTILHIATTCNMLRLLVKALKKKASVLKTILETRDKNGRLSYEKQKLKNNQCGSDLLYKEYSELPKQPELQQKSQCSIM